MNKKVHFMKMVGGLAPPLPPPHHTLFSTPLLLITNVSPESPCANFMKFHVL